MMEQPCDKCGKAASIYLTEISEDGQKVEKHLCEECAVGEGIVKTDMPISQFLEEFILQSAGEDAQKESRCDVCGVSFREFLDKKLLGCPNDYEVFEKQLAGIIQGEHEGSRQHIGKVPHRAGGDQKKQNAILRLRSQLRAAITKEDYEQAAALRDQIKELEKT